jgi:hypothetical protein
MSQMLLLQKNAERCSIVVQAADLIIPTDQGDLSGGSIRPQVPGTVLDRELLTCRFRCSW